MSNQLVKKNPAEGYQNVFPKTFIDAIKDKESGASLQEILQGFNMYFLSYNGSRALTRCKIPIVLRKEGLWITYVLYDHTVVTEWYNSDQIDDNSWGADDNWRIASNNLVGDVSVSVDGYWVINGEKTEAKAQGEQGVTPLLRIGANNKLQVSYNVGKAWRDISDYIVPRFRYTRGATNNTAGIIQISMDLGKTWTNLSNEITNNLRIYRYIGINESLPTSGVAEGTVYMKGPYYDEGDTSNANPIYRMWVYAWKGDTLAWQDNGEFTSISAGVVQERGNSTTEVMSQDAVTRELTELESEIGFNLFDKNFNKYIDDVGNIQVPGNNNNNWVVSDFVSVSNTKTLYVELGWEKHDVIGLLWGYDVNKSNPQRILTAEKQIVGLVNIPANVAYIVAWSDLSVCPNPIIKNANSIENQLESLNKSADEVKETYAEVNCLERASTTSHENELSGNSIVINKNDIAEIDGILSQVSFYATSPTSSFYIATFTKKGNSFKVVVRELISAKSGGLNNVKTSLPVRKGEYIGVIGNGINPIPNFGSYTTNGWYWSSGGASTLKSGMSVVLEELKDYSLCIGYQIISSKIVSPKPKTTIIVATRNAEDYNSIREIIGNINDASEYHRYVIKVPNGRWFECDLQGKECVTIEGEDRDKTILYCDGQSAKITPLNYAYGSSYYGAPLNALDRQYKHCVFAKSDLDIRNLTIEVNDAKYCVHLDDLNYTNINIENCHLIAKENTNNVIGIGVNGGQTINVRNCVIERTIEGHIGVFIHNWNNQSMISQVTFDKCHFKKCNIATIDELGSVNDCMVDITNSYCDTYENAIVIGADARFYINPDTGVAVADAKDLPYNIKLNMMGTNLHRIYNSADRPNAHNYIICNFDELI